MDDGRQRAEWDRLGSMLFVMATGHRSIAMSNGAKFSGRKLRPADFNPYLKQTRNPQSARDGTMGRWAKDASAARKG